MWAMWLTISLILDPTNSLNKYKDLLFLPCLSSSILPHFTIFYCIRVCTELAGEQCWSRKLISMNRVFELCFNNCLIQWNKNRNLIIIGKTKLAGLGISKATCWGIMKLWFPGSVDFRGSINKLPKPCFKRFIAKNKAIWQLCCKSFLLILFFSLLLSNT